MFSANHRRHLLVAFRHFDTLLSEVFNRLGADPGEPLFDAYRGDADAEIRLDALSTRMRERLALLDAALRGASAGHADP